MALNFCRFQRGHELRPTVFLGRAVRLAPLFSPISRVSALQQSGGDHAVHKRALSSPRVMALRVLQRPDRPELERAVFNGAGSSGLSDSATGVHQAKTRRPALSQRPASAHCSRPRSCPRPDSATVFSKRFVPLAATPAVSPVSPGDDLDGLEGFSPKGFK